MFEITDSCDNNPVIKVIGVGGAGGNALRNMAQAQIEGVDLIAANTDAQALRNHPAGSVLQLGANVTGGLGAGMQPERGRQAALEDKQRIHEIIAGADMLFITAGMGGGTGTGAAPVVADIARELGILTVAVVCKPFAFEGSRRMAIARSGLDELSKTVDSLIVIPNERLPLVLGKDVRMSEAFVVADGVLVNAVSGIAELITRPGLINLDFADVRTVMSEMGMAMMGSGRASGADRARKAAEEALASPLLEEVNLTGARGVLVNVTAGLDLSIGEFEEVGNTVRACASEEANVVVGTVIDPDMTDELRVTVVATGLAEAYGQVPAPREVKQAAQPVARRPNGEVDYHHLERPAVIRRRNLGNTALAQEHDADYLDVPAFLRQQAD